MHQLLSGNVHLEAASVNIGTLRQATLPGLQPAAAARGVQLIASVDSGIGDILADSRRLQQVL